MTIKAYIITTLSFQCSVNAYLVIRHICQLIGILSVGPSFLLINLLSQISLISIPIITALRSCEKFKIYTYICYFLTVSLPLFVVL